MVFFSFSEETISRISLFPELLNCSGNLLSLTAPFVIESLYLSRSMI